eukprot:scaffold238995_cov16-Prasinocladus_malaysianus.AAC.1
MPHHKPPASPEPQVVSSSISFKLIQHRLANYDIGVCSMVQQIAVSFWLFVEGETASQTGQEDSRLELACSGDWTTKPESLTL